MNSTAQSKHFEGTGAGKELITIFQDPWMDHILFQEMELPILPILTLGSRGVLQRSIQIKKLHY